MALHEPKSWHLPPGRRIPDAGLKTRLDERGHPYYRPARMAQTEKHYLGLEYLTARGVWAPERRTLSRLITEGLIDHQNEKLLRGLKTRGIHLQANFASSASVHDEAFREIGGSVCARVLNVLVGNRPDDPGVVSRTGWHPLGFVMRERRPDVSFIEAGQETPLELDRDFLVAMEAGGIHRAVEAQLRTIGIVLNGVPYGLMVKSKTNIAHQDRV